MFHWNTQIVTRKESSFNVEEKGLCGSQICKICAVYCAVYCGLQEYQIWDDASLFCMCTCILVQWFGCWFSSSLNWSYTQDYTGIQDISGRHIYMHTWECTCFYIFLHINRFSQRCSRLRLDTQSTSLHHLQRCLKGWKAKIEFALPLWRVLVARSHPRWKPMEIGQLQLRSSIFKMSTVRLLRTQNVAMLPWHALSIFEP